MRSLIVVVAACSIAACTVSPELASSPDADRIFAVNCDVPPATTGKPTFTAIYTELFSAGGAAKCQDSTCHGGSMGQGGLSMGTDQKGAYDGLVAFGQINPAGTTTDDPPATVKFLYNVVVPNKTTGKPTMPNALCGNRILNDAELQRLKDWGKAGAKND